MNPPKDLAGFIEARFSLPHGFSSVVKWVNGLLLVFIGLFTSGPEMIKTSHGHSTGP